MFDTKAYSVTVRRCGEKVIGYFFSADSGRDHLIRPMSARRFSLLVSRLVYEGRAVVTPDLELLGGLTVVLRRAEQNTKGN